MTLLSFTIILIPTILASLWQIKANLKFITLYRQRKYLKGQKVNNGNLVFLLNPQNFIEIQKELFAVQKDKDVEKARKHAFNCFTVTVVIFGLTLLLLAL